MRKLEGRKVCAYVHESEVRNGLITANVQASNTVRVILQNKTGSASNPESGTVRVTCFAAQWLDS